LIDFIFHGFVVFVLPNLIQRVVAFFLTNTDFPQSEVKIRVQSARHLLCFLSDSSGDSFSWFAVGVLLNYFEQTYVSAIAFRNICDQPPLSRD